MDFVRRIPRVQRSVTSGEVSLDSEFYLQELLNHIQIAPGQRKEIRKLLPSVAAAETVPAPVDPAAPKNELKLLVVLLYVCRLSQDLLGMLFGRSKTAIHNWIHELAGPGKAIFDYRIDEIVVLNSPEMANLKGIVDIQLQRLYQHLAKHNITWPLSNRPKNCFDPVYGARLPAEADDSAPPARCRIKYKDPSGFLNPKFHGWKGVAAAIQGIYAAFCSCSFATNSNEIELTQ